MSVANPTRLERVRDLLIDSYQAITIGNGFRQTIVKVDGSYIDPRDTPQFPIIQVYLGDLRFEKLVQDWSIINIKASVYVVGQVKGSNAKLAATPEISNRQNEVYKMIADISAKTSELVIAYANDATRDFVFDFNSKPPTFFAVPDFAQQDVVSVFCNYGVLMRNVTFATMA
jgi:hypothetical protein